MAAAVAGLIITFCSFQNNQRAVVHLEIIYKCSLIVWQMAILLQRVLLPFLMMLLMLLSLATAVDVGDVVAAVAGYCYRRCCCCCF
jgi:hypothetical protein